MQSTINQLFRETCLELIKTQKVASRKEIQDKMEIKSASYFSRMMNGNADVPIKHVDRLQVEFKLNEDYLFHAFCRKQMKSVREGNIGSMVMEDVETYATGPKIEKMLDQMGKLRKDVKSIKKAIVLKQKSDKE